MHRWRGGHPLHLIKNRARARFLTVTVMGWRRRRPSCLSPCRLTQFPRYFPIPSPPPIFLVLGMAWKGTPWRSTDVGCWFDFMAPVCRGAFINTLAWSERACSGASDLWLVTGSCALFRGRGCTPVRGIFRGKFYDGLFDAASSHQLSYRRKEHECSIRQLQLLTRISLHSHSKEDSNAYSFAGE